MPRSFLFTNKRYKFESFSSDDDHEDYKKENLRSYCNVYDAITWDQTLLDRAIQLGLRAATHPHEFYISQPTSHYIPQTEPIQLTTQQAQRVSISDGEFTSSDTESQPGSQPRSNRCKGKRDATRALKINQIIADHTGKTLAETEDDDSILGETHICGVCGKAYSTSSNLARHRQTHRSLSDKKARKCPHCDKVYVSMPAYSMHVRTHNQGCECSFCGKRFSRPWLLQGHIRTHTGEKPFKCPICCKAFADKSNLRAHIQTHSNEKPYVCGRCGKAFALKSYLYKHEESSCMRGQRYHREQSEEPNPGQASPDRKMRQC